MPVTRYLAGWSLAGCLPDAEPAYFNSEEEAQAYIDQERQQWADHEAERSETEADYGPPDQDPYVYWLTPREMLSVCVDCYTYAAYRSAELDLETFKRIEAARDDGLRIYLTDTEPYFSMSSCEYCGSRLGGDRFAVEYEYIPNKEGN